MDLRVGFALYVAMIRRSVMPARRWPRFIPAKGVSPGAGTQELPTTVGLLSLGPGYFAWRNSGMTNQQPPRRFAGLAHRAISPRNPQCTYGHPATVAKPNKNTGPQARLPKGFLDMAADEIRATDRMLDTIRQVYERYGFEPLETPAIEYTDALGKFLPDQDRPNEGVFSFQDEDEQWLSLRYDLTAPLARYVAEGLKEQKLSLPFRRYAVGPVWRNEKPGPGRFASSPSSTPTRSAPTTSPPTPRSACSPPTRWRRWASSAATT